LCLQLSAFRLSLWRILSAEDMDDDLLLLRCCKRWTESWLGSIRFDMPICHMPSIPNTDRITSRYGCKARCLIIEMKALTNVWQRWVIVHDKQSELIVNIVRQAFYYRHIRQTARAIWNEW
jgi:hypothetical protein